MEIPGILYWNLYILVSANINMFIIYGNVQMVPGKYDEVS